VPPYPEPAEVDDSDTLSAYPVPGSEARLLLPLCPTPAPTALPIKVPYRHQSPEMTNPAAFEIDIPSVKIEGDVAYAVIQRPGIRSELILVKVDDQWYIAGGRAIDHFGP
jgi:hypothetical protein